MSAEQGTMAAGAGAEQPPGVVASVDAGAEGDGRGPGARLRAAREARQLGVQQVTDLLHIDPRLVGAMEADDFTAFDAPVYARGFLRKYATFLELPPAEILGAYERLHAGPGTPSLIPPATAEEPRRDWSALKFPAALAGLLVLVGGSYWWWLTHAPAALDEPAPVVESAPAPGTPLPAESASPDASVRAPDGPDVTDPAAVAGGAVAVGAPVALGPIPAPPSGAALEIDFSGDCWVEVLGPTGERLMYGLGRAGESRALPGPGPWRVFLGAADSARLRVSGRPVAVPVATRSGATARLVVGADGAAQ